MAETVAPQEAQILYLEPDDEITSVVRRFREADAPRVVLVAPGRTKATTSAIGLRLLAREAADAGRTIALVADPAARALAAEAGIPAFPSVTEAQSGREADPREPAPAPARASIHVVRGERIAAPAIAGPIGSSSGARVVAPGAPPPAARHPRNDDTQPVPVVAPPVSPSRARSRRTADRSGRAANRTALAAAIVGLVVLAALVAAILPGATVRITPKVTAIGPLSYTVALPGQTDSGTFQSSMSANVTGTYDNSQPAKGVVTFANYNFSSVTVPKGTRVSAGAQVYTTDAAVTVPQSPKPNKGGTASTAVTATVGGPDGNVEADAVDTVDDGDVSSSLCPFLFGCPRLVANRQPITGGVTKKGSQVIQKDVDALVAKIKADVQGQLADHLAADNSRVYAEPAEPQDPVVTVPSWLVGTKDKATFNLSGTLAYDRQWVSRDALVEAGREQVAGDVTAHPAGTTVVDQSVTVEPGQLTVNGDQVSAPLTVQASVMRDVNLEQLKASIEGKSRADAIRALASMGSATITFWPGWVDAIPRLAFRIDMGIETPPAGPSTAPSVAP